MSQCQMQYQFQRKSVLIALLINWQIITLLSNETSMIESRGSFWLKSLDFWKQLFLLFVILFSLWEFK